MVVVNNTHHEAPQNNVNARSEIDVLEDAAVGPIVRALGTANVIGAVVGSFGAAAGECLGIRFMFQLGQLEDVKRALRPFGYEVSAIEECAVPGDTSTDVEVVW